MAAQRTDAGKSAYRLSTSWAKRWLLFAVRAARAGMFCTAVLMVILVAGAGRVRGEVGEKMTTLGRELLPLADVLEGVQRVRINGELVYFASTVSAQSMETLLDRFEQHCQENAGGLAEEFDALPEQAKSAISGKFPSVWAHRLGIMRRQGDGEGMVVCVAQTGGGGIAGLAERVQRLVADGDLSHMGNLRYAYVRKTENGKTHVITTFTEGSFNLFRAIGNAKPPTKQELDGVPLRPDAIMPMTIRVEGMPYAVQTFRSPAPPEEIAKYYLDALPGIGWERITGPGALSNVVWRRDGVILLLTAMQLDDSGETSVVLTQGTSTIVANAADPTQPR